MNYLFSPNPFFSLFPLPLYNNALSLPLHVYPLSRLVLATTATPHHHCHPWPATYSLPLPLPLLRFFLFLFWVVKCPFLMMSYQLLEDPTIVCLFSLGSHYFHLLHERFLCQVIQVDYLLK